MINILKKFANTKDWIKIKGLIKEKASFLWIMNMDKEILDEEGEICPETSRNFCLDFVKSGFLETRRNRVPYVFQCEKGLFAFFSPVFLNDELMGVIGACRIKPRHIPLGVREIKGLPKKEGFVSFIEGEEIIVLKEILQREGEFISNLTSSFLKILLKDIELSEKEDEFLALSEAYKLFSGEYSGEVQKLGKQNLYFIIVDLIARAMGAEICSLMTVDKKTQEMKIEAAIGLDPIIMAKTRLKVGEGIAGYVAKTGKPLLVTDIDNDPRFKIRAYKSNRYYTKSLISVPLIVDGEVFAVVCVNNKTTREPFSQQDLDILTLLLSRIIRSADGEIIPFPIKFKETSDLVIRNEELQREIDSYRGKIASIFDEKKRLSEEKEKLSEKIKNIEELLEIERKKSSELSEILEKREDVEYLKELLEKEKLKAELLEQELSILKEKSKEKVEISKIEEEIIEQFKKEAIEMIGEEKEEDLAKALEEEREAGRKKDGKIKELTLQIETLKREKVKEEVALLKRQKELVKTIKLQKSRTEIEELSSERERIEVLLNIKRKIEGVAKLYEEAKKLKDKKQEVIHRETLERLRKQAAELEELRTQTRELSFLYKLSSTISNIISEDEIFDEVLKEAGEYFACDVSGYLILRDKKLFAFVKSDILLHGPKIEGFKRRMKNEWLRLNPIRKKNIKRQIFFRFTGEKGKTSVSISSYISSPIRGEKRKVIGVLFIASCKKDAFSKTSSNILSILTDQLGMAVERARLFLKEEILATRDELTHVFNFRYFSEALEKSFEIAKKRNRPLSMIMLDFDHLKFVNDTYGHVQGNRLIKTISRLIEKGVREGDIVGRFGGDEFGIILQDTSLEIAYNVSERIRRLIAEHKIFIENKPLSLTASLGISGFPSKDVHSPSDLIKIADTCLYRAKQEGRNKVVAWTGS
ncbi:TPA: hypothetical protein DCX16_01550 [bacterium]|nr:hypothetical protein [bacterium]